MADQVTTPTITLDGVQHEISKFSAEAQKLLSIRQVWEQKTVEAELEFARARSAVRDLDREIVAKLQGELEAESAPVEESTPAE